MALLEPRPMRRSATFAIFNFSPNNTVTHWGLISQRMASRFSKTTSCHDFLDQHFHFYIPFNLEIRFWCVDNSHFAQRSMSPFWSLGLLSSSIKNQPGFLKKCNWACFYVWILTIDLLATLSTPFTSSHHPTVRRCSFLTETSKSSFTLPTNYEG